MKRRFDFRLRRLLRVRDIEETLARSEWAQREGAANAADDASLRAADAVTQARADIVRGAESPGPVSPVWLDAAHGAVDGLNALLRQKRETSATLRAQADTARDHWRQQDARRRGLIELEARARIQHRVEVERADNAEMDEIASMRSRSRPVLGSGVDLEPQGEPQRKKIAVGGPGQPMSPTGPARPGQVPHE